MTSREGQHTPVFVILLIYVTVYAIDMHWTAYDRIDSSTEVILAGRDARDHVR